MRRSPSPSTGRSTLAPPPPRFMEGRNSTVQTASSTGSFYAPTTSSSFSTHHPATREASVRPPLPQFPPSFQKHFANRSNNSSPPPALDLSTLSDRPKVGRTDMPILSLTPSPPLSIVSSSSYHHSHSRNHLLRCPSSPATTQAIPRPVTPIIPVSPASSSPPSQSRARSAIKRLSARWGLGPDVDSKQKVKVRNRVEKELAGLEKERVEQAQWEQEKVDRSIRARQQEEEWDLGLKVWSPLRVDGARRSWARFGAAEKGEQPRRVGTDEEEAARKRKRRYIWIAVIMLLLLLIGVTVGLLVTLLGKKTSNSSSSTSTTNNNAAGISSSLLSSASTASPASVSPSASGTATVPASSSSAAPSATPKVINLASCLADFPSSNATAYCNTCNEFLSTATNDFLNPSSGTAGVGAALQYCGLKSVFDITRGTSLAEKGWFPARNGTVCNWGGVTCDDGERIVQLNLTYPAVPETLPSAIGNLVALQTLSITGSTTAAIPSGSIPTSIYSLSQLTSLSIVSTALSSAIPNTAFASSTNLQSLQLVDNQGLGTSLPTGLKATKLTTLIVTGQSLSGSQFGYLPETLTYLDLSYNSLTSLTTDIKSALPSLVTLLASSNSLSSLPSTFPSTLQTLSLSDNSGLTGTLNDDLCSSSVLSRCAVNGTSVLGSVTKSSTSGGVTTATTSCGPCTF